MKMRKHQKLIVFCAHLVAIVWDDAIGPNPDIQSDISSTKAPKQGSKSEKISE